MQKRKKRMRHFWPALFILCDVCILSGTKGEITDSVDLSNLNSYEMMANDNRGRAQAPPPPPKDLECFHCSTVNESDDCYNATVAGENYGTNVSLGAVLPHTTCTDDAPYCQASKMFDCQNTTDYGRSVVQVSPCSK